MSNKSFKANFIYNTAYQLSSIIIPIITLPYLTRTLHAQGLGEYSFAYSIAYYFYMFVRLGLQNYGNRTIAYVKDDKALLSKTFCEIYAFQLFMGIVLTILYIVYASFGTPNRILAWIFLLVVFSGGIDLTWALYGLEEFKVASVKDISVKVVTAICIFSFVKNPDDVWKYSLIYSFGFFASHVISFPVVTKKIRFVRPDYRGIISHIKPNLILFLPTIAISIYKTMDKIMLGSMANDVELGYYHSSENIIMVPLALINALGTVMLPRMSNMLSKTDNREEVERIFDKSILFVMFISTMICIGIMTVAKEFVPLFFGRGFEKCVLIFYIILPSCIFLAFANVIRTQYLIPRKMDIQYIISLFLGAGVNLLFNVILIPRFASVGAAIGTLTAEIVVCVVQAVCVFKEANIGRNIKNSIPFIVSGIAMFAVFYSYTPVMSNAVVTLLIKIVLSGTFYMLVLGAIIGGKILIRLKSAKNYR